MVSLFTRAYFRTRRWCAVLSIALTCVAQVAAQADPSNVYTQDAGPDKLVSIPLEHPTRKIATEIGSIFYNWIEASDATAQDGAYTSVPNNDLPILPAILGESPTVEYDVNFVSTGIHYLYFRHRSPNGNDNSLHVFFDDVLVETHEFTVNPENVWEIEALTATINIASTGLHTVQILMREDGTSIDHLTISDNVDLFAASLPLDLLSFQGKANSSTNLLRWTTAHEENTDRFVVQRFINHKWATVGVKKALNKGDRLITYEWEDPHPDPTSLYRLQNYDLDGSFTLSNTIVVNADISANRANVLLYPNPARERVSVRLGEHAMQSVVLILSNTAGQRVLERQYEARADLHDIDLGLEGLVPGTYLVGGMVDGKRLSPQKLLVRK
ncbi:hypothetical protein GGR28_001873 [Lewinella aquimaris]|uniref:T9SS type A sorting domain-containing protein n=1 Tax=Neolewinella aquimaris TaxID=1835722 RepID=A0A840E5L7_9BACT|nr:hypothetical protein [Neolewinella aquimaris]MBB4079253.1 hypothetical protein [Neolewinella aquimaris]